MDDRELEEELASLELDDSAQGLDTSVASSQLTDFLVQHGVLSPTRVAAKRQAFASSSISSSSSAAAGGMTAATIAQVVPDANVDVDDTMDGSRVGEAPSYSVTYTPERRSVRLGINNETETENNDREDFMAQTPRSGISSLGLASPAHHHPLPPLNLGTGEGLPPQPTPPPPPPPHRQQQGAAPTSSYASWEAVNRLLRQEGYRTVEGVQDQPGEMLTVLKQVLRDRRELGDLLKSYQMERQRRDSDQRLAEGRLEGMERARGNLHETLQATLSRADSLEEELERTRRECQEQVREAKVKATNLVGRLRQSEHRVKMRDVHIDKMKAKIEMFVARDAKQKEREKNAFRRLQQREPRPADGKLLEVVGAVETARVRGLEEIKALKEEVQSLNEIMKEKDNYIASQQKSGVWQVAVQKSKTGGGRRGGVAPPAAAGVTAAAAAAAAAAATHGANGGGGPGVQHLLEQVHGLEKSLRLVSKREQGLNQKVEALESTRRALQTQVERLEQEKAKLTAEIKNRPTLKAWKTNQRHMEEMEARLKNAMEEVKEASSKVAAATAMNNKLKGGNKKEILAEICRVLDLSDSAQAKHAIARMAEAMAVIPPLEAFVKDVCGFLARSTLPHGQHLSPEEALRRMSMEEASRVLRAWAKELQGSRSLKRLQSRLRTILSNRDGAATDEENGEGGEHGGGGGLEDDDALLESVAKLVTFEHDVLASRQAEVQVEGFLASRPDILVNRVVQHFRLLFQVKSVEGLFPKMNEVYAFTCEMANFARILKSMLRLSPTCPNNTLLAALQKTIRKARGKNRKGKHQAFVLEGVPEESELEEGESELDEEEEEEEEDEEEEKNAEGEEGESILLDGGDNYRNPDESVASDSSSSDDEEDEEEEEISEQASFVSTSLPLDDSLMTTTTSFGENDLQGQARGGGGGGGGRQKTKTTYLPETPLSSASASASSSSSIMSSKSSVASSPNVTFAMLGVLSAAESQSNESPFPPARRSNNAGPYSSSESYGASSSSAAWTHPLPGEGINSRRTSGDFTRTGSTTTTTTAATAAAAGRRTRIFAASSSGGGGNTYSGSGTARSSSAGTGTLFASPSAVSEGLLGVLSFAASGQAGEFPTPAKEERGAASANDSSNNSITSGNVAREEQSSLNLSVSSDESSSADSSLALSYVPE